MKRKSGLKFKKRIKRYINEAKNTRKFYVNACLERVNYKSRNSLTFNIINVKRARHYSALHYSFKKQTGVDIEYIYGFGLNGLTRIPVIRSGCTRPTLVGIDLGKEVNQ